MKRVASEIRECLFPGKSIFLVETSFPKKMTREGGKSERRCWSVINDNDSNFNFKRKLLVQFNWLNSEEEEEEEKRRDDRGCALRIPRVT